MALPFESPSYDQKDNIPWINIRRITDFGLTAEFFSQQQQQQTWTGRKYIRRNLQVTEQTREYNIYLFKQTKCDVM